MIEDLAEYIKQNRHFDGFCMGDHDLEARAKKLQAKIDALKSELRNAEGYLWDASDASQWEDYINGVPHLKSEYTKENDDE